MGTTKGCAIFVVMAMTVTMMALAVNAECGEQTEDKVVVQNGYAVSYKILQPENENSKLEVTIRGPENNLCVAIVSTGRLGRNAKTIRKDDMAKANGFATTILELSRRGVPLEGTCWELNILTLDSRARTLKQKVWYKKFVVTPEMVTTATTVAQAP